MWSTGTELVKNHLITGKKQGFLKSAKLGIGTIYCIIQFFNHNIRHKSSKKKPLRHPLGRLATWFGGRGMIGTCVREMKSVSRNERGQSLVLNAEGCLWAATLGKGTANRYSSLGQPRGHEGLINQKPVRLL